MRNGWEYKRWKEVLTIINGKNQSAVVDENGEYPIYGSGGIMGYANNWLCPGNCVIIGRKGNINKPIFVETKFWNVDTAFGLNANKEYLLPKFLYYFCLDYNFERHNKAVTIPSLTKADLLKIDIPLPPKSTQLAIVSELDKINELIRLKKEQLKDFDNLAQSLFYEMFGDPVENEMRWEVKKLGDNVEEMFLGPFGSALKVDSYVPKEDSYCMVYEQKHAIKKSINLENHYINKEKFDSLKRFCVMPGDFIMSCRGTIGKLYQIPPGAPMGIIHPSLMKIRLKQNGYDSTYFNFMLVKIVAIESTNGNCVQMDITAKALSKKELPLPPLPLQHLFAQRIEQIEHQKSEVQKAITDLETLLASRIQYWFE